MIFECLQEYLNKGLATVVKAVPVKGSLPVLSNVLISAESGKVKLTATNLETVISFTFGAEVKEEGSTTVPAKMFYEFVSNLDPGKLLISSERNILHVTSFPKSKSKFNGMSSVEFPELPSARDTQNYLKLNPKVLSNLVSNTFFSCATDVTRPALTGTLVKYDNGILTFVTTDGFRLSEKTYSLEGEFKPFEAIIPTKTLSDISKIFSNYEEEVSIIFNKDDSLLFFTSGDVSVAVRVIDGAFPDYKRIIPATNVFKTEISHSELSAAVKLTNIFSKESSAPIKVELNNEGIVKVYSATQDSGEHVSEFESVHEGDSISLSFSAKFLVDLLNNLKSERITLESNGGVTPVVFRSPQNENYLHLIMPMKI